MPKLGCNITKLFRYLHSLKKKINEIEIEISHELFHFFRSNLHLSADIFRIFEYEMRKFEQN